MNTEKLEKLKKSLDNKFIPDNMKDKIRAEIKKLEADIKTDETITATEVKEEVKEIEKKVEKALEVAEEKEEKAEAKKEEAEERAEAKAEEKKAKKSRTKTQKVEGKPKSAKKSVFSIAKEIRKDGETWEEAKERARKMMKSETTETKKKTKTETQKLLAMVRRNKEYKKLTGSSDLLKDAQRRALPRGKRVSENGNVYYENRANRVDVGGFKNAYLENGGGVDGIIELKPLALIPLSTQLNRLSGYGWTYGDWESEDGGKPSTMPNSVIVNVHTKQKFRLSPIEIEEKYPSNSNKPLYAKQQYRIVKYSEDGQIIEYSFGWHDTREDAVQELKEMFGSYADKGVYVETLDEEIDLTDDGKPRVIKTQQGGNKSFGERREMHGASPEALAFDNGGVVLDNVKIEVYKSFHGLKAENYFDDVNGYDWNVVTMKRHTGELVSSARGGKANKSEGNVEFFTFDYNSPNIKLISSRPSRVTEKVIEIQHSQALQLFKEKMEEGNFADGGTIIGTPETPLARGLDIDYTGLVGETGGMSAGEMFAMGGSLGNHGLKQGDQIIKTMSGGVQKVKTKSGDIVYVNLANGYRGAEPPLPFAKGGYTNERRHVNKSQDYEVRYAKNKPNRTGYLGKRSFDEGGISNGRYEVVKVIGFDKNGKTLPKNEIKVIADFDSRKEALNFVYEQQFKKDVTQRDIFIRDTKTNKTFAEGGFMTDPNFGDFQNGVYATGGVTKNYIGRNQLNTITIKKGNQKLTYKVSDVYNGAYKLEEGGNLEKTAFYVSKRNVVKVQLKNGKDVKVANGYWIKKGAKPIHTSKYDDGGEMGYAGGGKTTFKEKATAIAKNFEGKKVEPKYQKEYGKTYDKAEAKEVGNKIAGSQKAKYDAKMSGGGSTKRGGAMQLAKQIRKDGESWQSALKRANEQMRKK